MEKPQKDSIASIFWLMSEREYHSREIERIDSELDQIQQQAEVTKNSLIPPKGRGRPKGWTDEIIAEAHAAIKAYQEQHSIKPWGAAVYQWLLAANPDADLDRIAKLADDIAQNHVPKALKPKNSKKSK